MNVYDSGRMADVVAFLDYDLTDDAAEADLVIFNTCHIREKATEKLYSELGRLHEHKKARQADGQAMIIAVAGCVAQAEGEEVQRRAPFVDIVMGPQTYHQLPEMLACVARRERKVLNTNFPPEPKFDFLPEKHTSTKVSAFLSVQEGCDRFCSYCVVPYTRGAEYSRPVEAIEAEAVNLVQKGAREITLLGQNVNAQSFGLSNIINKITAIPGLLRLRYTTSHPSDMGNDLIAAHRDNSKLMPFLHLPVQSGSDKILAAMNRKHTADDYYRVIEKLRTARPDLSLSTDFIVGFPGETDADFQATMKLVRRIEFAQAYSFKYSRRPGTPAAELKEQIDEKVKSARLEELQALLRKQQKQFNQACVGQTMSVLIENKFQKEERFFGRTPYGQAVRVKASAELVGQQVAIKIKNAALNNLSGETVSS